MPSDCEASSLLDFHLFLPSIHMLVKAGEEEGLTENGEDGRSSFACAIHGATKRTPAKHNEITFLAFSAKNRPKHELE